MSNTTNHCCDLTVYKLQEGFELSLEINQFKNKKKNVNFHKAGDIDTNLSQRSQLLRSKKYRQ